MRSLLLSKSVWNQRWLSKMTKSATIIVAMQLEWFNLGGCLGGLKKTGQIHPRWCWLFYFICREFQLRTELSLSWNRLVASSCFRTPPWNWLCIPFKLRINRQAEAGWLDWRKWGNGESTTHTYPQIALSQVMGLLALGLVFITSCDYLTS